MLNELFATVAITVIPVLLYFKKTYSNPKPTQNIFYSENDYINIWSDDDDYYYPNNNYFSESDNEFQLNNLSKTSEFSDIDEI
jgi:hypothetical protein